MGSSGLSDKGAAVTLVIVISVLVAGFLAYSGYQVAVLREAPPPLAVEPTYAPTVANLTLVTSEQSIAVEHVYSEVRDSIVTVSCMTPVAGEPGTYQEVVGSGFFVNYTGRLYVVTNYHVVDGAQSIAITLINGTAFPARVVGEDPYSDLAVLGFNASVDAKPLSIAPSSSLTIGETVIAVGSPYGLAGSLTVGAVSQLNRSIQEQTVTGYPIADLIQTSAPINPGNSGGPLLDLNGDVVGINTAIISNSQGLGFAIPSDTLLRELPYLVKYGTYDLHPWLGVEILGLDYFSAKALNLSVTYGVEVVSVVKGGPAYEAGVRGATGYVDFYGTQLPAGGDVIIAVNGTPVTGVDSLTSYIEEHVLPGDSVILTVIRNGTTIEVPVIVGARPPPSPSSSSS